MDEEERAYYTYYATNLNNLAPECQAPSADPLPAAEESQGEREERRRGVEAAEGPARGGARQGAVQGGRARAQTEVEERETARRQRLARQAQVQEELHHQRMRMDEARLGLAQRRD